MQQTETKATTTTRPATPITDRLKATDARRIMKIGTWYNSADETLTALGLPANRKAGQRGFVTA